MSLTQFQELSYFDNEALFYLLRETPIDTLSLAFLKGDQKVIGSMLGILDAQQREKIHLLMVKNQNRQDTEIESAISGLLLIADGLIQKGLIEKKGRFYYGSTKDGMK